MVDFGEIATLLHLEEKLRGQPTLAALLAHVRAALGAHNALATHEDLPEIPLTKEQEAAAADAAKQETK